MLDRAVWTPNRRATARPRIEDCQRALEPGRWPGFRRWRKLVDAYVIFREKRILPHSARGVCSDARRFIGRWWAVFGNRAGDNQIHPARRQAQGPRRRGTNAHRSSWTAWRPVT